VYANEVSGHATASVSVSLHEREQALEAARECERGIKAGRLMAQDVKYVAPSSPIPCPLTRQSKL